ncbi:MAG TPA: glycine betaine ABC transporter substrate-binding protein [Candidatus Limnocylindrales bacterium]
MRTIRSVALGATMLALLASACTSGGSSTSPTTAPASEAPSLPAASQPAASATAGPAISTTLVLGGPAECPNRPFCLKGLQDKYGLAFKDFKALDSGGPLTVQALKSNLIQVGLLFTSDAAIAANQFVLLQDDKQLQLADNLVPVVRQAVLDKSPGIADLLNGIMAKLSQTELTNLNKSVGVDHVAAADAAKAWLTTNGFLPGPGGSGKGAVVVGSTNFSEQEILGELFAQVLVANGYQVDKKFQLGNREVVFPALQSGKIDILAEYAATLLEFVNKGAGEATSDAAATVAKLKTRLAPLGLTALNAAAATDQNGFVVTNDTATKYGLVKISDLGKPLP